MENHMNEFRQITNRNFSRLLNPRSTLLVTCCDSNGKPNILSVAWHSPLSIDPPLVGISISPKRYSHGLIESTGEYVIHVVGTEMQKAVDYCGGVSGRNEDKINQGNLIIQPAKMVHPPVLSEAYGYLECQVEQAVPVGDHTWFVGKVLYAAARAGFFSDTWDADQAKVLLYLKLDQYGYFCSLE
jgi:flavin reductase (DIM6/NTAB) family NADH-FMN oxidoreductase RutF